MLRPYQKPVASNKLINVQIPDNMKTVVELILINVNPPY